MMHLCWRSIDRPTQSCSAARNNTADVEGADDSVLPGNPGSRVILDGTLAPQANRGVSTESESNVAHTPAHDAAHVGHNPGMRTGNGQGYDG